MTKDVAEYFSEGCGRCALGGTPQCKVHQWQQLLQHVRVLLLESGLTETCKWGIPCYTFNEKNVCTLAAFKAHGAINFFKGALLDDPQQILEKAGPNAAAGRIFKFDNPEKLKAHEADVRALIQSAIVVEQEGRRIKPSPPPVAPHVLQVIFKADPALKMAFEKLTPGRQKAYIFYFSEPKKEATRLARIEKYKTQILNGVGLHDAYKSKK